MIRTRRLGWLSLAVAAVTVFTAGRLLLGGPSALAGSTLLSDDFEADTVGAPAAGWSPVSGQWAVAVDGTQVLKQSDTNTATAKSIHAGSSAWTDYSVVAQIKPGSAATGTSNVLAARYIDDNNAYSLILKDGTSWYFGRKVNGVWTTLGNGAKAYNTSTWYTFEIDVSGKNLTAFLNGTKLAAVTDSTFSAGAIAVMSRTTIEVDNVVVTGITPPPPPPSPSPTPSPTPSPSASPSPSPAPSPSPSPSPSSPPSPSPSASPTLPTNNPSTIQGTVTVAGTFTPIAGATVTTQPATTSATTDSNGAYALNVTAGTYNVIFQAGGFNSEFDGSVNAPANGVATADSGLSPIIPGSAQDLFSRPDQAGMGTASDGHSWADDHNVYPTATVSISSRSAYVQTASANTDFDTWMGIPYRDQEITADLYVVRALSDPQYLHGGRLLGRVQGSDSWIVMAINTANDTITIWVDNAGNWTQLGVGSQSYSPNVWYHAKLDIVGSSVMGKAWPVGSAEPGWQVTGQQSAIMSPGVAGLRCGAADVLFSNYQEAPLTQVTGKVTDATTGAAIAGATVSLSNGATGVSDAAGKYVFSGLTPGTYTVTATATGHNSASATATVSLGLSATGVNLALS